MSRPANAQAVPQPIHRVNRVIRGDASIQANADAARRMVDEAIRARREDPAIALYRAEKAKRGDKQAPLMAQAKEAFKRLLEDTAPHKHGRPRGVKSGAWKNLGVGRDRELRPRAT